MSRKKKKLLTPVQVKGLANIDASKHEYVLGIDEAGMGCLAGPVVVAAAVLPKGWSHPDVKDSKTLSYSKLEKAWNEVLHSACLTYCVLQGSNEYIDQVGIEVVRAHLTEACALYCRKRYPDSLIVQDGIRPVPVDGSERGIVCLPKADALVPAVSAGSMIAKLSRDTYMKGESRKYPGYGFDSNVGYFSKKHWWALNHKGVTPLHRKSFGKVKELANW